VIELGKRYRFLNPTNGYMQIGIVEAEIVPGVYLLDQGNIVLGVWMQKEIEDGYK